MSKEKLIEPELWNKGSKEAVVKVLAFDSSGPAGYFTIFYIPTSQLSGADPDHEDDVDDIVKLRNFAKINQQWIDNGFISLNEWWYKKLEYGWSEYEHTDKTPMQFAGPTEDIIIYL